MNKIALEYTNTAELQAKREEAVTKVCGNANRAFNKCRDKFYQLVNKSNVKFHSISINEDAQTYIYQEIKNAELLKKYGPEGKLYKISNKETKKFNYELTCMYDNELHKWKHTYVQEEAIEWCLEQFKEDRKRAEKFLNRKTIKNIIAEIKAIHDNKNSIIAHYDAMVEKAQQIQTICADYKDMEEFIIAIREEAKKLGYFTIMKNNSIEFHKDTGDNCYARQITAYATLPYSRKKEKECIIFTNELLEQVMQPLHDALKVDTSWEDKYKDLFYFNKMKTKVKVHVSDGDGSHWLNHVKEYSKTDFTEVNFKNWLKNVEVNERRHLTNEFLKKARSVK